jgi:uncharacterized membrane protein
MPTPLSSRDQDRIVDAIRKAETKTSGEIRVHVQSAVDGDAMEQAKTVFDQLGLANTRDRIGVLIFVAIDSRKAVVLGDKGIDETTPSDFWESTMQAMIPHFKRDNVVAGVEAGISMVAQVLKAKFPYREDDVNELDNAVSIGD